MRLWADERKGGTLEVLLTLPVPRWQLVVGKFLSGMVLIAVALGLTLGLPLTIARMGNLDLGPVFGGYLATLLLAGAYLAIGMCVSAATDNQIIAFLGTAAACAVAYFVGYLGDVGRLFGTGARFDSVARGVLDLRDLAYYGGIIAVGTALNVVLLERLTWGHGAAGKARRVGSVLAVVLVAGNAIALDLWLAPVQHARIDLTQGGTYSLSDSTRKVLAGLDERLLIRGYFSKKTHPRLAPLVPELRDLLEEYEIAGAGKVRVEIVDPSAGDDAPGESQEAKRADDAKREAKERFGIDPTPFQFETRTEESIVNGYFAVAIEYGDQHTVLGLRELVTQRMGDIGEVEILLKNPEYELTKAIKKTVAEFSSIDTLFASTAGKVQLTAYITPSALPAELKDTPAALKKVADELTKQSGGKFAYATVEPKLDDMNQLRDLFTKYGWRPFQADPFSDKLYYFQLLIQIGNRAQPVALPRSLGEAELKTAITDTLKRAAPGFTRVVGVWSPPAPPPMPAMQGMPPQEMPPPQSFRALTEALRGNYEVREVQLSAPVPDEIESLVLAGPAALDAKAAEYVDQFVMRGGALVVLDGRFRLAMGAGGGGLAVEKVATGLESVLQKWGITVPEEMVLDEKSDALPVPQNRDLGNGMVVREFHRLDYPYFVQMDGDQLTSASPITHGLTGSVMHWASPVKVDAKVGDDTHKVQPLLTSSPAAWLSSSTDVQPDQNMKFAAAKNVAADKKGAQVMAAAITGGFASSVAKPVDKKSAPKDPADKTQTPSRLLEHSPPDTRIVVFGSSAFVSDDILGLAQQLRSNFAKSNLELVHNAVDWSLADTDLLEIRSRNDATRALTIGPDSRTGWLEANIVIAIIGLVLVVGYAWLRRRSVRPLIAKET